MLIPGREKYLRKKFSKPKYNAWNIFYAYKVVDSIKIKNFTFDMPNSIRKIVCPCFPKAIHVIDPFHVQKLALNGIPEILTAHCGNPINSVTKELPTAF